MDNGMVVVHVNLQTGKTKLVIEQVINQCLKTKGIVIKYYCVRLHYMSERIIKRLMEMNVDFSKISYNKLFVNGSFIHLYGQEDILICTI